MQRLIRYALSLPRQILSDMGDKPLAPPTPREQGLIDELRNDMREDERGKGAWEGWSDAERQLRDLVLSSDPREFTRWEIIRGTMFMHKGLSVVDEFKTLKKLPDWSSRWEPAVQEARTGRPRPYFMYPRSSGNLIHHAHHLLQIEKRTPYKLNEFSTIFEFGGGFGSTCRLFHRLGFSGRYTIFDLPAFSKLQRFYLRMENLPVLPSDAPPDAKGIELATSQSILPTAHLTKPSLFIAGWSLSETPKDFRPPFIDFIQKFDCFLIGYNERYIVGGGDDRDFWRNFSEKMRDRYTVTDDPIPHLPPNHYLIGWRR